jgi:uncharacterized protein (TIGR02246 family)
MKFIRNLLLIAASAFMASASFGAQSGDAKLDRSVRKANSDWVAAVKTGDASTIAEPYAEDGIFVGIDGVCTRGRAAIEKMYRERFERSGLATSATIDSKRILLDGDFAYESGRGEIRLVRDGKASSSGGRFLTVWHHQADGEWKILRNIVLP